MPRCCAAIYDPNNPSNVLVYVDVDGPDAATAKSAAEKAALAAFAEGKFAGGPPNVDVKAKPGQLTKQKAADC
ncbi:MAG: hypothetical protein QOF83_457 [Solirubrobacteraceae bacterium]|jgi:hypothetical protein|nr:hypothetical protein [Solirubrobacteraceae bacterium]